MLEKVRKINSFLLVLSLIYIIQNYTIGQIPIIKDIVVFEIFNLKELLFIVSSCYITINHFKFKNVIDNK
jgi:hypothetical protein